MRVYAGDLFAALVTAIGHQTETEKRSQEKENNKGNYGYSPNEFRKSQFLQNVEKMLDAVKRGEQLELVYPDDLQELA